MTKTSTFKIKQEPIESSTSVPSQPNSTQQPSTPFDSYQSLMTPESTSNMPNSNRSSETEIENSENINSPNGSGQANSTPSAMESLGSHSRKVIKVIKNLVLLGIDNTLPSLPKLVVVGDQSHGKSSIIEAVCDISLPRSAGTCTRCPFEITTTASEATAGWSSKITLLRRYSYKQKTGARAKTKPGQWEDTRAQNAEEFMTIHDKSCLESALRLAQLAILNPEVSSADIANSEDPEAEYGDGVNVKFSPNIISLEISAPGLPEISLYDLPGTINVAPSANEQHLVGVIEDLVTDYLKDEKALVLLACSIDQDAENSTAFKYVRSCNALDRRMGVLTKADLITRGRISLVHRMLNEEIFKLGDGWFVTKHLSQEELDGEDEVTHAQARERERAFFEKEPWSDALGHFSDRFGISTLQTAISQKLTEHIIGELPEIRARVRNRLQGVTNELAAFPKPAKASYLTVMMEIHRLEADIVKHLQGESLVNDFKQSYRKVIQRLVQELKKAKPKIILASPGVKPSQTNPIAIDDSDDDEGVVASIPLPAKSRKLGNGCGGSTSSPRNEASRARRTPIKPEGVESRAPLTKAVFTLDQIKQAYEAGQASDLPEKSWKVTSDLAGRALSYWTKLVDGALDVIQDLTLNMLIKCIQETLATRRQTQLFKDTMEIVETLFLQLMQEQRTFIHQIVACEQHKPITYQALANKAEDTKRKLHASRLECRVHEYFDNSKSRDLQAVKWEERMKKLKDIQPMLGADKHVEEINAIAMPLAYYDVASAALPDTIAKTLEYGLMHALQAKVSEKLIEGLRVTNEEHCARLLAEDPAREKHRQNLVAEQAKLEKALRELQGLALPG